LTIVEMGADENEAYLNAVEALGEWMHDARLADAAPDSRFIEALRSDAEVQAAIAEGAIFLSVPPVIEYGRAVKANRIEACSTPSTRRPDEAA
jgi:hypothetical protein